MSENATQPPQPAVSVSMEMHINLGNYESAKCFVSLSGLHVETSPREMEALLDTGKIAYEAIRARLKEKVKTIRAEGQHPTESGWR